MMSTLTTSARRRSAILSAAEAPTLPAPMIETFLRILSPPSLEPSVGVADPGNDGVGELRALDGDGALHLPGQVVGDPAALDGILHTLDDQVGGLQPAHVFEHHGAGKDQRPWIDLVLPRVGRRRAVRRLDDGGGVSDVG